MKRVIQTAITRVLCESRLGIPRRFPPVFDDDIAYEQEIRAVVRLDHQFSRLASESESWSSDAIESSAPKITQPALPSQKIT